MLEKNLSNDKSLEVNVAISRKKLCCMIFDKKNDRKQGEPKTSELTVHSEDIVAVFENFHIILFCVRVSFTS
jgi:hypothetical protein